MFIMAAEDVAVIVETLEATNAPADSVKRAREFYRYLQPDNLVLPQLARRPSSIAAYNETVPSLSAALAPFCQLTALRCNTRKAMLNVMDRDIMYFLAEASRVPTRNGEKESYEFVEDPIMMACSSTPLKGRICELTLSESKGDHYGYPMFTICDLSKSDFASLGPIAGPPYYRFYAGTPITTSKGVNIGSLAVMDTEARESGLSESEVEFLGKTASQIMTYLETNRQAIEGRRARRLAEGLESFIAGKRSIKEGMMNGASRMPSIKRKDTTYGMTAPNSPEEPRANPVSPTNGDLRQVITEDTFRDRATSDHDSSEPTTDTEQQNNAKLETESRSHARTFARAANLLRESFGDLGEDGSVVFTSLKGRLDKPIRSAPMHRPQHRAANSTSNIKGKEEIQENGAPPLLHVQETEVLASSTWVAPFSTSEDKGVEHVTLSEDMLRTLMKRYPGGKLFTMDDPGRFSSSEDESFHLNEKPDRPRRSSRHKRDEHQAIAAAFPQARQALFSPIWDSSVGSFGHAVFVCASSDTRSLSATTELSFLNSFCSTVMAECSRIDTMKADKQKSDFVGTISHEMRSPLHGILASVEFLADTELTNFQESLVDTIESCGRTLLDTINHVLDFSKVNSFQKHWEASNKRTSYLTKKKHYLGPDGSSKAYSAGAPPLLQLFAVTDISAILEEVVDGLVLGQTFASGVDMMDMSRQARGRGNAKEKGLDLPSEDVQVVLDIQQADWAFLTQPGAVRRIVLNLTGNALKYTNHGTITVCLELRPGESEGSDLMILRVADTGKGISQDFLATKLFVPFAQENALTPGTGLGMSIVHSIVTMLGGSIDVKSQVGKGTTVEVALPLKRPLPGQVSTQNTPHSGGTASSSGSRPDESLHLLQTQATDRRVTFFRAERTMANDKLNHIVRRYVQDWYGLEYVDPQWVLSANVVLAEEEDLEELLNQIQATPGQRPALIVLCCVASRHSTSYTSALESRIHGAVSFVSKPVGPYKLAKSIRMALQKLRTIKPQFREVTNLGVIPERPNSETTTPLIASDTNADSLADNLHEMDLSPRDDNPSSVVQASETIAVSQISQNAQMVLSSPEAVVRTPAAPKANDGAFPFPDQTQIEQPLVETPKANLPPLVAIEQPELSTPRRKRTASLPKVNGTPLVNPRVLLVDDNRINLKLLQTFLTKQRKYTRIDLAEDGQQAVDVFELNSGLGDGYEIIFMDISMPVMNGFEATRAIREYEEQNSGHVGKGTMVIALTGLASGKDQAEGFDAGVDIYLTKPVSFKEVGKLLDNWEAHQKMRGSIDMPNALQAGMALDRNAALLDAVSPIAELGPR